MFTIKVTRNGDQDVYQAVAYAVRLQGTGRGIYIDINHKDPDILHPTHTIKVIPLWSDITQCIYIENALGKTIDKRIIDPVNAKIVAKITT